MVIGDLPGRVLDTVAESVRRGGGDADDGREGDPRDHSSGVLERAHEAHDFGLGGWWLWRRRERVL